MRGKVGRNDSIDVLLIHNPEYCSLLDKSLNQERLRRRIAWGVFYVTPGKMSEVDPMRISPGFGGGL